MILLAPLLAAGIGDILPVLVIIIIVIVSAVSQALGKMRQAQPPQGQAPQGQPPQPQNEDLTDEIGEFLRRAAQGRQGQRPQPAARPAPPKPAVAEPIRAEVVRDSLARPLDTKEFEHRTQRLGAEVAQADAQAEKRRMQVFGDDLSGIGSLGSVGDIAGGSTTIEAEGEGASLESVETANLMILLSEPESIRQAIILNEILRRPEDRWARGTKA